MAGINEGVLKMEKITFDYSKAAGFISDEEVTYMSKLVEDAKSSFLTETVQAMTSWDGSIFR